ncbi:MAG: hypothetical protein MI919_25455, partial [Holophagales bacterium]|nr:hypothetical protein [Holophagales bacterium]
MQPNDPCLRPAFPFPVSAKNPAAGLALALLVSAPAFAQPPAVHPPMGFGPGGPMAEPKPSPEELEEKQVSKKGTVTIEGREIAYTATVG